MFTLAATDPSISIPLWMQVGGGGIFALLVLRLVFDFLKDQRAKKETDSSKEGESASCDLGNKKLHLSGKNPLAVLDELHTVTIGNDGVIQTIKDQDVCREAILQTRDAQKENVLATKVGAREMMRIRCHLQNGNGPPMPGDKPIDPSDNPNQKTDVWDSKVLEEMRKLDARQG